MSDARGPLDDEEMDEFAALTATAHFAGPLAENDQAILDGFIEREGGPGRWGWSDPNCSCRACVETLASTLEEVRALARQAHAGQTDKLGRDYYSGHLEPIAAALVEHGPHAEMAGLLHDILEDTSVAVDELLERGVPAAVVRAVESVSKRTGETYDDLITRAAADPLGRLVKLADNAHNLASNDYLARTDPETAARLLTKYESARARLLQAGESRDLGPRG